jgi:2-methylisocitrate lyase-like PEP mutase family enzyme
MGLQGISITLAELSGLGVKRVSVGSGLSRAALGAFVRAAREMLDQGTFSFAEHAISHKDVSDMFNA